MYTVIKRMEISASHSLRLSYPSKCENLHGHNWMITVYCRSKELNADEEIVEKVSSFPARIVILTGGEPSLWIDKALISRLREAGKQICIETNGTRPLPDGIDWVTCSPKENAPVVLERIDEIKVVYTGQDLSAYAEIPARYHFLQPCSCQNTKEVVDYILRHPRWRLSLQTHKLIDIQ